MRIGDYQDRKWRSWQYHMSMLRMVMLFMLEKRLSPMERYPLLSCFEIVALLSLILPHRAINKQEVIRQKEVRHAR